METDPDNLFQPELYEMSKSMLRTALIALVAVAVAVRVPQIRQIIGI